MSNNLPTKLAQSTFNDLQVHLLGSEALLFCPSSGQLYYLNTSAAYIWCALLEGIEPTRIAAIVAKQFGIPLDRASRDVQDAVSNWTTTEFPTLCNGAQTLPQHLAGKRSSTRSTVFQPEPKRSESNFTFAACHFYRLRTQLFEIRYATSNVAAQVHPALAHLTKGFSKAANDVPMTIDVISRGEYYQLRLNGNVEPEQLAIDELAPRINRILLSNVFESSACLAAFHAGAVGNSQASVLLPGAPGNGKSTLVAALVDAGFRYFTDELALLMPDYTLCPLPISSGLKRGSWPLFSASLNNQPVHRQPDGTQVRYLPISATPQACPPLRAIIFPQYAKGSTTQLSSLSPARALYELSAAGYAVSEQLDQKVVGRLVAWIAPLPCYHLRVGELESAVASVRKILA